jgi:hypothetical protein
MKDKKAKLRDLHVSHALCCSVDWHISGLWSLFLKIEGFCFLSSEWASASVIPFSLLFWTETPETVSDTGEDLSLVNRQTWPTLVSQSSRMWWVESQFITFPSTDKEELVTLPRHNRESWRPQCFVMSTNSKDMCPVVGIQMFTSHTVSKPRGRFSPENSSPRKFFYVDMTTWISK